MVRLDPSRPVIRLAISGACGAAAATSLSMVTCVVLGGERETGGHAVLSVDWEDADAYRC
jgi:hypothetical protein